MCNPKRDLHGYIWWLFAQNTLSETKIRNLHEHPLPFHMWSAPPPRPIYAFRRFTDFIWIEILYFKSCKNTGLVMHKLFCWLKGLCHEDIALQILSGSTNHNNLFGWPNFFKFQIHAHPCGLLQQTTGNNFID